MPHDFVYLASQSPRRAQLLQQIGVAFRLLPPDADEDAEALEAECAGELPAAYVQRVTRAKLQAAVQRLARRGARAAPILCADTTVALGRRILGKPDGTADAVQMLMALAGHTHRVLTAVAVQAGAGRQSAVCISRVTFAAMTAEQIEAYAASGEPLGKAGGYAIQGIAGSFVVKLVGSYTGVVGLPLHETVNLLGGEGFPVRLGWLNAA